MHTRSLIAVFVVLALGVFLGATQQNALERFNLRLRVTQNGALVAQPTIQIEASKSGTLTFGARTLTLTPRRVDAQHVVLNVENKLSGEAQPAVLISLQDSEPQKASLAGSDRTELTVALLR